MEQTDEGAFLNQTKYAKEVLRRFGCEDVRGCRSPLDTTMKLRAMTEADKEPGIEYLEAIGSIIYTAISKTPDLAYPIGYLSQFVDHPTVQHGENLTRVIRYFKATT